MAQERWLENSTNQLNRWIRENPIYPTPSRGYQMPMPQYNSYWTQYRKPDYTQPIQNSKTPPINQALNETFQPQYIQTADYNGQPVRVPTNAGSQAWDYVPDALRWLGTQATENLAVRGFTGKSLGDWVALGARRLAPKVAGALVGGPIGTTITWIPEAVRGAEYLLSTPTAKTLGNGVKKIIDWGL